MPKKRQVTLYSIDELSEKARQRAVDDFWEHAFDDTDAATLTEDFTEMLKERGFEEGVKANWSLGYCQGDGVCFEGWVDIPHLIEQEKLEKFKPLVPLAARGILTARVHHEERRYCHKYSMSVDVELRGDVFELMPEELREQEREWQAEVRRRMRAWLDEIHRIDHASAAPIEEWARMRREFETRHKKGPHEWSPRLRDPGPKPQPLDLPKPPKPEVPMPPALETAMPAYEAEWATLEALVDDFREPLEEWVVKTSADLEKIGYDEIEYRQSKEAILEHFRNNEYEFTKDGERQRR